MIESFESALAGISLISAKYSSIIEYKKSQGEYYNVFSCLGLENDEVNLHSRFIADLLDPNSLHGMGDAFLRRFVHYICSASLSDRHYEDFVSARVEREKYIGPINRECTSGGAIDVFVELTNADGRKTAIVVENKIWAGDQNNQLLRYRNYCKNFYDDNYVILYLTINGHEPSVESVGAVAENDVYWMSVSYMDFIKQWIEECICIAAEKPNVRQVLVQYRDVLSKFSGRKEVKEMSEEYIAKLLEGDFFKQVCTLAGYIEPAKERIVAKLKSEIEKKIDGTGIELFNMDASSKVYTHIWFRKGIYQWVYEFEGSGYQKLVSCVSRTDKQKKDLTAEEKKIIENKFPELGNKSSGWAVVFGYVKDSVNGNSMQNWSIDLFSDMNKNPSAYAEYFVSKAKEAFERLEK